MAKPKSIPEFFDRTFQVVGRLNRRWGTTDPDQRAGILAAFGLLESLGKYEVIRTIKDDRIPLLAVHDHWQRGTLDQLGDVNLAAYVEPWKAWALRHAKAETVEGYLAHLRVLVPEGKVFPRSQFTRRYLSEAGSKLKCQGPTVRRYLASWSTFAQFLVERDLLDVNPLRSVTWPRENPAREVWLPLDDVIRLVDGQPEPYRALAALREGTGAEVSAALATRRKDVDVARQSVHLHGTKGEHRTRNWRDRLAFVDPWAMERLAVYILPAAFAPDALLFPVTAQHALRVQKAALKALGMRQDYRLHDARHSYAVRKMQAGAEPQLVANNLGHASAVMVLTRYGKYRPAAADIARLGIRVTK